MHLFIRLTAVTLGLAATILAGCAEYHADKPSPADFYERYLYRRWYYARTIVDVPFESQTAS